MEPYAAASASERSAQVATYGLRQPGIFFVYGSLKCGGSQGAAIRSRNRDPLHPTRMLRQIS